MVPPGIRQICAYGAFDLPKVWFGCAWPLASFRARPLPDADYQFAEWLLARVSLDCSAKGTPERGPGFCASPLQPGPLSVSLPLKSHFRSHII